MADTVGKLVLEWTRKEPELTLQWVKDKAGIFQPVNWKNHYQNVQSFAAGLLALGVKRGDHIGIISDNMREWM